MSLLETNKELNRLLDESERDLELCRGIIRSYIPHVRRLNEVMEGSLSAISLSSDVEYARNEARAALESVKKIEAARMERVREIQIQEARIKK